MNGRLTLARWLIFLLLAITISISPMPLLAQQKPKLRPLRIALPSNTIAATHFYVGKSLGIFESHGFDPQILVLEPRAALAALMTGDLDFYTATGTGTRAALRNVPVRIIMVGLNRPHHVLVLPRKSPASSNCAAKYWGAIRRRRRSIRC
jgi:ABC-type nitrate/sulfonate/bicarbonate transport system substrate-binding protein